MKTRGVTNIFFSGVGGQGIIMASDLVAELAFRAGLDVKKNEIHGMSQRGGSVTSHVRFGDQVHCPMIMEGEAHFLVAFEELEAVRWAHMVRPDGRILVNQQRILPASVTAGDAEYPEDVRAILAGYAPVTRVPAFAIARELGGPQMVNTAMMGALSAHLPGFTEENWTAVISDRLKSKALRENLNAFHKGRECADPAAEKIAAD